MEAVRWCVMEHSPFVLTKMVLMGKVGMFSTSTQVKPDTLGIWLEDE